MMLKAMDAVRANDSQTVAQCLLTFADSVQEIGTILDRMYEKCDPEVFYHRIRPFLAGSKNMVIAGLPNGVFYDEGAGQGQWRQYSGGSNAQSSLIQFFDIVLGVEHSPTRNSKVVEVDLKAKHGFLSVRTLPTISSPNPNPIRKCAITCQVPIAAFSSILSQSPISATTSKPQLAPTLLRPTISPSLVLSLSETSIFRL